MKRDLGSHAHRRQGELQYLDSERGEGEGGGRIEREKEGVTEEGGRIEREGITEEGGRRGKRRRREKKKGRRKGEGVRKEGGRRRRGGGREK